jgi:hypothetical protein
MYELFGRYPDLAPLYRNDPVLRAALDLTEREGMSVEAALAFALVHVAKAKAEALEALSSEIARTPPRIAKGGAPW